MINKNQTNIPNAFWKFYDLYRRKIITIEEFSQKAQLDKKDIQKHIREISRKIKESN